MAISASSRSAAENLIVKVVHEDCSGDAPPGDAPPGGVPPDWYTGTELTQQ